MNNMNEAKKEQLSAFMDGEIDGRHENLVDQLLKDPEMLDTWSRYHLISDCLKQCLPERIDNALAENISKSLRKEPTVIAPGRFAHTLIKPVAGFAIAASVAALAILGIQQQFVGGPIPQDTLVQTAPGGATGGGSIYAPVRQVSSSGSGTTTECDGHSTENSQPDAGNRVEKGEAEPTEANCR